MIPRGCLRSFLAVECSSAWQVCSRVCRACRTPRCRPLCRRWGKPGGGTREIKNWRHRKDGARPKLVFRILLFGGHRQCGTVGFARATKAGRLGSILGHTADLTNGTSGLSSLVFGVNGWVQGNGYRAGLPLPPVQHSLKGAAFTAIVAAWPAAQVSGHGRRSWTIESEFRRRNTTRQISVHSMNQCSSKYSNIEKRIQLF